MPTAFLSPQSSVLKPCMWFMEEPGQFSVGQTAQSLTCSIMEKPHTGLDDCLRVLQSYFRKRMSVAQDTCNVHLIFVACHECATSLVSFLFLIPEAS